jgi:hypothetical protein
MAVHDVVLSDDLLAILDGPSVATLATVGPDGQPRSRVVGLHRDGDVLLLSIAALRRPSHHLSTDAQVSVSVFDPANPGVAVEIRGTARLLPESAERYVPVADLPVTTTVDAGEGCGTVTALPRAALPADAAGVRLVARLIPTAVSTLAS